MEMLIFVLKASERSLHYESRSKSLRLLISWAVNSLCTSEVSRWDHNTVRLEMPFFMKPLVAR